MTNTNIKKISPLDSAGASSQRTIFHGIGHLFTCLREISHKIIVSFASEQKLKAIAQFGENINKEMKPNLKHFSVQTNKTKRN